MLWLCQITFAGVGAITTAELATTHGWPVLAAVAAGGVIAMVMGLVVGLLSIRLGDLYVALVTLTFGLLVENLVFTLPSFVNSGLGLTVNPPSFATSPRVLAYLFLGIFVVIALFIVNFRRSTSGLAMNAVRWSDPGARTTGVSVVQMKVTVAALAALVAGIGGGLLAIQQSTIAPGTFDTFLGVVWLAVLVTIGIRSTAAAIIAGLSFVMLPALAQAYLPTWTGNIPPLLFGLGAISAAKYPDGALAEQSRRFRNQLLRLADRQKTPLVIDTLSGDALVDGAVGPRRGPLRVRSPLGRRRDGTRSRGRHRDVGPVGTWHHGPLRWAQCPVRRRPRRCAPQHRRPRRTQRGGKDDDARRPVRAPPAHARPSVAAR